MLVSKATQLIVIICVSSIHCQFSKIIRRTRDSSNPLSFGGSYITNGECPWLCAIYFNVGSSNPEYKCGSSLISNQYVVTAAHCVRPKSTSVTIDASNVLIYAGIHNLNEPNDPNVKIIPAQDIKIHPNWNVSSIRYDADISLIKMTQVVKFNRFIQRIALPTASNVPDNVKGFVVGYGVSETSNVHETRPRRIQIPVVDAEECYQNHHGFSKLKSRQSFCAGENGVIPCNGDSGSGFFLIQNTSPVLFGIVSSGIADENRNCRRDSYVIFTDVTKFIDWIKKEVGSGYLSAEDNTANMQTENWKNNDAFCEYIVDDGYQCKLQGVRSTTNDIKISNVNGQHRDDRDDDDVNKVWIIDQEAKYIPEMSNVAGKFKRIQDLRIWSCGLKYIERSKLSIFAKRLRVLDFFNNHIEEIPVDAFDDLERLEELKILNNRVKQLPENLFHNLKNLKWFFAENNEIEELPEHLFDQTQIVVVSMKNNLLKRIFVDFRKLRNVNVIDFNQNTCINQCIGHYCGKMSVSEMQQEIKAKC